MSVMKHRTRYWPYFSTMQDVILMKRHSFKDQILFDVDWYLHYVASLDDRELLKIGEFQNRERTGFVAFYGEAVLDSFFRAEARNDGDSPEFVEKLRDKISHLKFFFDIIARATPSSFIRTQDISGSEKAVKCLEAWQAKSDEELKNWAAGVIEKEGWGTRVFI